MFNLDELALNTLNGAPGNQNQKDIQDALLRYFTLKNITGLEGDMFDSTFGSGRPHQALNSTEELNDVEEGPSSSRILAALGINLEGRLRSVPRQTPWGLNDLLHSAEPPARSVGGLLPFYKEAHYVPSGRGGSSAIRRVLGIR